MRALIRDAPWAQDGVDSSFVLFLNPPLVWTFLIRGGDGGDLFRCVWSAAEVLHAFLGMPLCSRQCFP